MDLPPLPHAARWGACVVDVASGATLAARDEHAELGTASIGKVLLLAELAARPELLDEPLTRTADDAVADSGVWQHLATDTLPARDLAVLVGAHSDNLATNVLLRRIGFDAVHERAATLGLTTTRLHDRVRGRRGPGDPPHLSTATAHELAHLARALDRENPVVVAWLRTGTDLSMVAPAFGLDPLAHMESDRGWELWNKTGTNDGIRADMGVVRRGDAALAYALIANWDAAAVDPRDEVLAAMRRFGEALTPTLERCSS